MRISDGSSDVCSSDLIFGIGHEHAYPFLLGFCYCEAFSQSSTIANAAHYNPDDTHSLCGRSKYARGAGSPLSRPLMLTRRETGRECIRGAPHLRKSGDARTLNLSEDGRSLFIDRSHRPFYPFALGTISPEDSWQ